MTRAEYLAANTISRDKPWLAQGISRATWYRQRKRPAETSPDKTSSGKTSGRKAANDNKINDLTAPEVQNQAGNQAGQDGGIEAFRSKTRNSKTYKETIMDVDRDKDLILVEVRKQKNNRVTKPPITVLASQYRLNELTVTKRWVRPRCWNKNIRAKAA